MFRAALLGSLFLLAGALAGCSDDTVNPRPEARPPDAGPDRSKADIPAKTEGLKTEGLKTEGSAAKQYSGTIIVAQSSGRTTWGPPKPDAGPPATIFVAETYFVTPDPVNKPDFIDSPAPPNCVAYKWTATSPMKRPSGDAGKVTIAGLKAVQYLDGDNLTTPPKTMPTSLECTRKQVGSLWMYDCGLPVSTVLLGAALEDTSALDISAAGGADITAFSEKSVAPGPVVKPKASFDLNQLDPAAIKAEWETTAAPLVAIDIIASLKDGSEYARISCTALALLGSKEIPAGALAVLPKPTATNPLILRTALIAFNVKGGKAAWGDYTIGVGRGTFGVSCRTPAGQCP